MNELDEMTVSPMEKELSVVIYVDDLEVFHDSLANIEKDTAFQEGRVQVILLDALCSEASRSFLSGKVEAYPASYRILECQDMDPARAYNQVIGELQGRYVCFTRSNCVFDAGSLDEVLKVRSKKAYRIITLRPIYKNARDEWVDYCPRLRNYHSRHSKVNLLSYHTHEHFTWAFEACFFSMNFIKEEAFDERLFYDYRLKFLFSGLEKAGGYILLSDQNCLWYGPTESDYFNYPAQYSKEWYFDSLRYFMIPMMSEEKPLFLQYAIMYLLDCRYASNLDARDSEILNHEEYLEFLELSAQVMEHIDDLVVTTMSIAGKKRLPNYMKLTMLRIKYRDTELSSDITVSSRNLMTSYHNYTLNSLRTEPVQIKVIYYDGESLLIDGSFFGGLWYPKDSVKIMACVNETYIDVRPTETYGLKKMFNHSLAKSMDFQFAWKSKDIKRKVRFSFFLVYGQQSYKLRIDFTRDQSKLGKKFFQDYWIFDHKMLTFDKKRNEFCISNYTKKELFIKELKLMKDFAIVGEECKWKAICLRILYWMTRGFYKKKHIWMTQDKLFKGGDNGEYLFRYIRQVDPADTDIYYVLSKNAPEYEERKKEFGKYLVCQNSLRHQLLALNTDIFLATHVDVMLCNGFSKELRVYFRNLFNGRIACIAHGLTIQQIAQYQNRVFDNTVLYFFASKYEVENVSKPIYDYYDKSMLKLTGHARYDGLHNNDQKMILITPTWRRSLTVGKTEKGSAYGYSETFKHSTYYHIYNNLIHDERITESARKNGYKIVYLLHPAMSPQLPDFESTDICQVVAATSDVSYEKVLTESSLMITDYSGVQFDFAYMKKPLIYYHPEELPAQYQAGGLIYETMGFGPICTKHDEVVRELCDYMDHQCVMQDEYKRRVDDFFAYDDYNNCERIYQEVVKFQERFEKVNTI